MKKCGLKWILIVGTIVLIVTIGITLARSFDAQLAKSGRALVVDVVTRQINLTCQSILAAQSGDYFAENIIDDSTINLSLDNEKAALVAAKTAVACADDLAGYESLVLSIPRGAFTNSAYFADKGGMTHYTVSAAYTVSGTYHVSYEAVGINQIRYALYLQVTAVAHILIPRQLEDVTYCYAIPLCEKVYSGKVPNVFVNGEDATDYLDLLPD